MSRLALSALATAALLLSGCNPCQRLSNAEAGYASRGQACDVKGSAWSDADVKQCESGLSKCSADDQKSMDAYADCLNKLSACQSGGGFSYSIAKLECWSKLSVSYSCASAVF